MTPEHLIKQFKASASHTERMSAISEMTRYEDITPFIETIINAALDTKENPSVRKCALLAIRTRPEITEHSPNVLTMLGKIAIKDSDKKIKEYANEALEILLPTAQTTAGKFNKTGLKIIEKMVQESPFSPYNGGKLINPIKGDQRVFHENSNAHPLAYSFWRIEHSGDGEVAAAASPEVKKGMPPSWFPPTPDPE